jgi:predicted site-specific integrase-resolvase
MAALKQYLTPADVCGVLQVGRTTLWHLVQRGELRPARLRASAPSRRPGAKPRPRLRFDPEEVERYVRRCTK